MMRVQKDASKEASREDPGAFVPGEIFQLSGRSGGPLAGLTFAVKDLFDIAGRRTGAGNPTWRDTHDSAARTAVSVERLLNGSATLIGKSITDELAYSIVGKNWHYGIPRNGAAPDRMPGGSSSGSASAVSNGLCDFALGTDSGGSVRVPASYCGLFGMRPTHGRIPLDGCLALTPSYDTCGWFARTPDVLGKVGHVLLESRDGVKAHRVRLVIAPEVWSAASDDVVHAIRPLLRRMETLTGPAEKLAIFADEVEWSAFDQHSRNLQAFEAWCTFGEWIRRTRPVFGPDIEDRFRFASSVGADTAEEARIKKVEFAERMARLLPENTLICIPTTPTVAALRNVDTERLQAVRLKTLQFTCIAGMAGVPQLTVPVSTAGGAPCGLSLIGRRGDDELLLWFARLVAKTMK